MSIMTNAFRLDNEVALITGGGTGLGLAIARCLVVSGARVVITGRREDVLKQAVEELGPNADYVLHDVTQTEQAHALVATIAQRHRPLTILVNNAGINLKRPAIETSEEEFLSILQTNVLGAHALVRAAAPGMIECGRGSILFIASMASLFGIPGVVAYSAAKSGLLGMVRTLATELSPQGVRVNAIAPGWIETAMSRKAMQGDPERERKILSRTPLAQFGTPEDIGWAAVYLSSPAARFVTGVTLPVDGGVSIGF
jgi:NAD(P)-dependent dehydrogenase (short-subunit alcohol dehydrogenase family)